MAEKILNTRLQLKGDTYSSWSAKDPILLENELAVVIITAEDGALLNKPGVYFKIGDGRSKFSELGFTSGLAGDVAPWAKAPDKPVYDASEIDNLESYISGKVQDTNTKYQLVQNTDNEREFTLQSKELDGNWTDVNTITIPETVYTLVEGTTNGTIKFNGTDVPVHGLKSAAYTEASSFDAAGAAAGVKTELIGTDTDTAASETIKGVKKYAQELVNNIPEPEQNEYIITKATTATAGYFATYELTKNGTAVGAKIDIPKDYLVKSATIKTAVGSSDPSGLPDGTKYIDFVINSSEGTGNESHIYLNVADLVDTYTEGDGITVSSDNKISAKVVAANGLTVDATGIKLSLATATAPGAMSAADKDKIDKLHAIATSGNVNDLVQTSGDILILNCGNATL